VGKPTIEDSTICTVQGVFIQLGDTSGAFATVAIAAHTFIVLINRTPPSTSALLTVLGIKWALVVILAMIGPLAFATDSLGPFCE
jgi:heme A synthase